MIKIVKADSDGNIKITEDELNFLLNEAYNEGYDKGYSYGKSSQWIKWYASRPYEYDPNKMCFTNNPNGTSSPDTTLKVSEYETSGEENGVLQ